METDIMKNTIRLIFLTLALISCSAFAQIKEVRNLDKFTNITNYTSGNVYVKQGSPQKVEIEGKKEILADIKTDVSGGKLKIHMKNNSGNWNWFHDNNLLNIYITVENIDAINLTGSGNLTAQTKLTGNNMVVSIKGSGDLEAEMELTGQMDIDVEGSGNIDMKGKFQNLKTQVEGSGDVDLSVVVANQAEFNISGSGEIKVNGKAQTVRASISGSGDLMANNLETDKCTVHVSGSGEAQVYVKSQLDASASGSGDISYRGNPVQVSSHSSGSGDINKTE
jgi:hypothetical protein